MTFSPLSPILKYTESPSKKSVVSVIFAGKGPFSDKLDVIILGVCATVFIGMEVNISSETTTIINLTLCARIITCQ